MDGQTSGGVTTKRAIAGPILHDAAYDLDFTHVQLADISRNFADEAHDSNLLLHWLLKWVDGGAVILSTFASAWAASLFLTEQESMQQFAPDLVAILAFFVVLRLR
jgi:hypothetical protein